jgi:hypothetical protein
MRGRTGRRAAATAVVLALGLVSTLGSPAAAGPRINCAATGAVNITPGTPNQWDLVGSGLCLNNLTGPYQVAIFGTGTSDTLGLCGDLLVTNLKLKVAVALHNTKTGQDKVINESWGSPITTFPLATPFIVGGPGAWGLGSIFTRILLSCPPGGTSGATFLWTQAT